MTTTPTARPRPASASPRSEAMRRLFLHQDGFAVASALGCLDAIGSLPDVGRGVLVADLVGAGSAPGAVAAGLRALHSAGLVSVDTAGGHQVVRVEDKYAGVVAPLVDTVVALETELGDADWSDDASVLEAVARTTSVLRRACAAIDADAGLGEHERELAMRYAEGVVATPALPRLQHVDTGDLSGRCDDLLDALGLGSITAPTHLADGLRSFQQVYGLMGSYVQPALAMRRWLVDGATVSTHLVTTRIDRRLNVLASGNAHKTYFQAAHAMVRRLFDDEAYVDQPKAIVDVGCGDGTWLRALFQLVGRTQRGRVLDRYPLLLVGVDVDPRALKIAEDGCQDLPAVFLAGDIGRPDLIIESVAAATGLDADDLLHIRAFVDHNRTITASPDPEGVVELGDTVCVDGQGTLLADQEIRADWVRHYRNWSEYSGRHGLLVIEGHTLPPDELARRRGGAHALAFEFYHGLSGQSPMSYEAFQYAAHEAGLRPWCEPLTFQRGATPTTSVQLLVSAADTGCA